MMMKQFISPGHQVRSTGRKSLYALLSVLILTAFTLCGCGKASSPVSSSSKEESSSQVEISSEVDPSREVDPSTEAGPTAGVEPTTKAEPTTEAESTTEAKPTTEAESTTEAKPTTGAESITEAEPTTEVAPSLTIDDIAFIGDSRTLSMASGGGLEFHLIPDSAVFATWGGELTQESARTNALTAGAAGRKMAVFWYGINDVQSDPEQKLASQFRANYEAIIDLYRSTNPDSDIVILSILSTSVQEKDYYSGQEENIRSYNAQLAALCAEKGYTYLDITGLFTGDECLAPGDNIHFSEEWYVTRFLPTVLGALGVEY